MQFASLQFLLFLPVVFAIYWSLSGHERVRKVMLLLASAIFYMAWNPAPYLFIIWCSSVDYLVAGKIHASQDPAARKRWLLVSLVSNLSVLGFFKYANLVYETIAVMGSWVGLNIVYHRMDIILPIGLSFVIFQTLSYTIDVYRRECEPRKSYLDVILYISFFPHLLAGPIVRARDFLPQLDTPPRLTEAEGAGALLRIAKGLVKKMLIADLLSANLIERVFAGPEVYTPVEVWVAVFAYTLQIYYDFSAYSDVAIGTARLFGIEFKENFDRPYKAMNLPEFWQRWHISLSTWLRDYLYISVGGNRGGKWMTLRNVMITMTLGGIWHGASWRMALWGALHGLGLCVTRIFWWTFGAPTGKESWLRKASAFSGTILYVVLARIFFKADSMETSWKVFAGLVPNGIWAAPNVTPRVLFVFLLGIALHYTPANTYQRISDLFVRLPIPARAMALMIIALVVKKVADFEVQAFIYFQF